MFSHDDGLCFPLREALWIQPNRVDTSLSPDEQLATILHESKIPFSK